MKIIFMGTPDFAVPVLEALVQSRHEVVLAVTQPDRMKGRSAKLLFSPVKECAVKHGIEVFQPARIKTPEAVEKLQSVEADIMVVAAYGQILSTQILEMKKYGCINVHGSLLPQLRGAAPIQKAVIDGLEKTGITIMQMDAGLDTGDMILKEEVVLDRKETAATLFDKLSLIGGPLLLRALDQIEDGTAVRIPQDSEQATYAGMFKKEMGLIDWNKPADEIERLVRGMDPWPCAYTYYKDKQLKIWSSDTVSVEQPDQTASSMPGTVIDVRKDCVIVRTGSQDMALALKEVQLEGKKRMSVRDFLLGTRMTEGEQLGSK